MEPDDLWWYLGIPSLGGFIVMVVLYILFYYQGG